MVSPPVLLPGSLPPLRAELQLHPGPTTHDGAPSWVIQDPVNNGFYRVGWLEFELLSRWGLASPQQVLAVTRQETVLAPTGEELAALYQYLLSHQLLDVHDPRYTQYLLERRQMGRLSRARWLLHHYLFFRVPLLHPEVWLKRLLPWFQWVFSPATAWAVLGLSGLGLLLVARQWDGFLASFRDSLSWHGLVGYLFALALTKSLHELGHALTATRYGLRVAHMGVAFVVMWPMLYTDTGESWRLHRSRQRLAIASAGVLTELAIAGLATLAWNLASDGSALKQALFYLASTAWLISLALNVSPFMRFDGYFILSDALDLPNLHERAGALAKAAMRRTVLGWPEPDPEAFSPWARRALVAFAYVTWLYRLTVFLGIAAAVYLYFFKLLGLFLFAVEIIWFVCMPIWKEASVWWSRRGEIRANRRRLAWGLGVGALVFLVWPWSHTIDAPAWAHPLRSQVLYSPLPARLVGSVPQTEQVKAGQVLFELTQPELQYQADVSRVGVQALAQQLTGLEGEASGLDRQQSLQQQRALREAEVQAHTDEAARLVLKAPFAGRLVDIDPHLSPGVWVNPRQPLATLVDPSVWVAEAFVPSSALSRVQVGGAVAFHAELDGMQTTLSGEICQIDATRTTVLPHAMLSSLQGGSIATLPEGAGLQPREAVYRIKVCLKSPPQGLQVLRGWVAIQAQPSSLLLNWIKPAVVLVIRELSF